ncbi:MAG: M56 family metallopeptidase, partial [Planctomycetota bacterium]
METFFAELSSFFGWLVRSTIQVSILVCIVLVLKAVVRTRLGARWHYYLWLLVVARMIMPWAPESRISLFNLVPNSARLDRVEFMSVSFSKTDFKVDAPMAYGNDLRAQPTVSDTKETAAPAIESHTTNTTKVQPESVCEKSDTPEAGDNPITTHVESRKPFSEKLRNWRRKIPAALPLIWLAGAVVLLVYVFISNLRLWTIIRRERAFTNQKVLDLLEDCKAQMDVHMVLGVVVSDKLKSAALFGFVRPRLVLPAALIQTLSLNGLRHIFLHELAHLKRHDILLSWLTSLLLIMHWFNPLLWYAFYRMRLDREIACDGLTLSRMRPDESHNYGRTIVQLLEGFSHSRRLPIMAGVLENKSQLKRRMDMISQFKKNSYLWSVLAAVLILMVGCVTLTDPK